MASVSLQKGVTKIERELEDVRLRLLEAEETLRAIRSGEVDAVVIEGAAGPQVYTLQDADRPYRIIVERMQEGALTLSPEGTILYANRALGALLGRPLENLVGQRFQSLVGAEDQDTLARLLKDSGRCELELHAADGSRIPVSLSVVDLPDQGERIISGIVTNLTLQRQRTQELSESNAKLVAAMAERERAEGMLRQAQKMEAVGQLTAGVAHDVNNLLTVIAGNLELIEGRVSDEGLRKQVETIQRAIRRGVVLTDQLLAFSRQRTLRPRPVSINALLKETEALLRRAVGEDIGVTLALCEDVGYTLIDPTELQASMLNLALNAKDAMPRGGSLSITTCEIEPESVPHRTELPRSQGYVMVAVTDTGHGMSRETRDRAFDPFFTTKEAGKGTGLGLSQVYGFIRQSGGHVTIDSEVGVGTTVRLYLPRTHAAAAAELPSHERTPGEAPLRRVVLVVEDDDDVRSFVTELLDDIGYTVIQAGSGPAALRLLDSGTAVDVVFTDVRMPDGMSGFQLALEIRRRLPTAAIVLTSGVTTFSDPAQDAVRELPILRKPFRRDEIVHAIEAESRRHAQRMRAAVR